MDGECGTSSVILGDQAVFGLIIAVSILDHQSVYPALALHAVFAGSLAQYLVVLVPLHGNQRLGDLALERHGAGKLRDVLILELADEADGLLCDKEEKKTRN